VTDFIKLTSGVLSTQECDTIIDFFEDNKERQYAGLAGDNPLPDDTVKIDTELGIEHGELIEDIRLFPVRAALWNCCNKYKEAYPFLNNIFPWHFFESVKIQKYKPNEAYFVEHCENDGQADHTGKRMIAVMVYLNTVTDGGQTYFPTQKRSITPEVGSVLMWPAYWTHPHHGVPSPSQDKYIITGWYVFN
tara:strand:- start:133 stop:705 length:573 start_codon:yes stop_codon:yes gene_type:complete